MLFLKRCHIIVKAIRSKGVFQKRVNCEQLHNAELCNGSTADSDSVCEGSNPSPAAKEPQPKGCGSFFLLRDLGTLDAEKLHLRFRRIRFTPKFTPIKSFTP